MKKSSAGLLKPTIGVLDGTKAYSALRTTIVKEGLLDRSYGYYFGLILVNALGFGGSLVGVIIAQNLVATFAWSMAFAFFSVQLAGVIHDAGHRAIMKSTFFNDTIGFILSSFSGISYTFWQTKHSMHHAHTNTIDEDPDIDIPLLTFSPEHAQKRTTFERMILKYQKYLYYPLGFFSLFYFRWLSFKYFVAFFKPVKILEIVTYLFTLGLWFIAPFFIFDPLKAIVAVLTINLTIGFYLMHVFAPNHKGMPQIGKHTKLSFLEHQIMTSRNIYGNWLTDYIYLGLNYQIEHHLFPNCPRNKLRRLTPHILKLCKELNLEYTEVSILESNKMILAELDKIAKLPQAKS